jgi:hypothetical protein
VGKKGNDSKGVKKGVVDVDEGFSDCGARDRRCDADPEAIGYAAKDGSTSRIGVRLSKGDMAIPRFLDGKDVGSGRHEEGMRYVISVTHVD